MSIFGKIKDAIFGKKAVAAQPAAPAAPSPVGTALDAATQAMASAAAAPVDVDAILTAEAANAGQDLNWRTSIVDLMKLLGIDSMPPACARMSVRFISFLPLDRGSNRDDRRLL